MAYVVTNYAANTRAPVGKWVCAPTSAKGPQDTAPDTVISKHPDYCGQCVSYVKTVCPALRETTLWKKGDKVKDNSTILAGTVIATFDSSGKYEGHAAIYVGQSAAGISIYDQYRTGPSPKPVGSRLLRWGARGNSNDGDKFYVVE